MSNLADEIFDPPETIKQKIARFKKDPFEASRLQSVFQNGRDCHTCSCHINPPCEACVNCEVCNSAYEEIIEDSSAPSKESGNE